ncbi:MAG: hypothetical protein GQ476_00460 [Candidatus Aminicenantes bacterium]|nr:hypothetical protein [Candidatus Aminicenantes bacterium]
MDKIAANKKSKPPPLFLIILLLVVFLSSCVKISDTDTDDSADDGNDPCGNALGSGNEVISGPSGPSGADNDSVFRSLTVDPTNPDIVIIGTERNGFVKSTDGGVNWTRLRYGLRHDDLGYPEIYDIGISASNTDVLYAATIDSNGPVTGDYPSSKAGFYKSIDGGQSWYRKNCGIDNSSIPVVHVDPVDPDIAIIGIRGGYPTFTELRDQYFDGGIYKSTNGGESWERITVEANDRYNDYLIIRMANTDPNTLITFGFNYDDLNLNLGFLKSTDNGSSWIQFAPDLKGLLISYFDISSDASVIYAVSRDEWKILKSADGGNTWSAFQFLMRCYALAVSPSDANRVLFSIMDKLYLSTDGMQSYTMVIDNIGSTFDDIVFASSNNNIVYAVTKGYLLYKSEDGGVTFSLVKNIRSDVLNVIP